MPSATGTWPKSCRLAQRPVTRIDGEMVSWYGSRAIAGLRYLAALRRQTRLNRRHLDGRL
jgi:hypothetical protein